MKPPKPKRGERRRIDAAIDHLTKYGFAEPQIRNVINDLLKLYGRDGWVLLEDGSYSIVLDKLLGLEEQVQQDQSPETPRTLHSIRELGAFKVFTPSAISRGTAAAEVMRRPKPKRGDRRIDAAIEHFIPYGFAKPQIRKVINNLLQVYGNGGDGWVYLEEGSYSIVLDKLLELEEQVQQDQDEDGSTMTDE